jgi:hypothetical protein
MSTQEEEEELFYKLSVCSKMGFFPFLPDLSLCAFNNLSPSENKIDFDFGRVFFFFFVSCWKCQLLVLLYIQTNPVNILSFSYLLLQSIKP